MKCQYLGNERKYEAEIWYLEVICYTDFDCSVWKKLKSRDFLGLEYIRAQTGSLSEIPNSNNSPEQVSLNNRQRI